MQALAEALQRSRSQTYRLLKGQSEWSEELVARAATFFGVGAAALRYGEAADNATTPAPPPTTEPAAPGEAGGLGIGSERELWERIGYYRGKQELALENSETSSRLAREASEMLDRAIRALREVHEHTVPIPRAAVRQITPAQEEALADAERAIQLRDAVRAEQEQASGARRRGGRAG